MKIIPLLRKHLPFVGYISFYFIILAQKLISNPMPFYDWDESIYSQVGIEMLNNWSLVPLWQGVTWLDKPPLVPLFYGLVIKGLPFIQPEISVRIATLILSVIVLTFIYKLYYKLIKEPFLVTLAVIITSITPIFLQRSQLGNIDVFLLLGWAGYILFYERFWWGLFFLGVAVMSKSLVGFYPVAVMGFFQCYLFYIKRIDKKELIKQIKKLAIHTGILLMWYVVMLLIFGKDFYIQHVYESHFKRVTDSIESHFGKRTFYIDLLFEQFGQYAWISLLGFGVLCFQWYRNKIKIDQFMYGTFIIPWFLFLNLTKTKIFWYGYPYIPQFALLMVLPLILIKRYVSEKLYYVLVFGVITLVFYVGFIQNKVFADNYASFDNYHRIAMLAKQKCSSLGVLVEPFDREAKDTLEKMDLTITTTKWWGNHPAMVYYYGGKVEYIYTLDRFNEIIKSEPQNGCVVVTEEDKQRVNDMKLLQKDGTMYLFQF